MIIDSLILTNYRSHALSKFEFSPNLNIITGENASGKTNVVEAIYYLSLARSFRGVEDEELIKRGSEWSEIKAKIKEGVFSIDNIVIPKSCPICMEKTEIIAFMVDLLQPSGADFSVV